MKKRKRIIIITIAVLIFGLSSVYAGTLIASKDVLYDNSKSNGNSNNVQGAIDELYSLASNNSCSISNEKLINENMISYVTNLAKTDTTNLAYDDTSDKNLRFIGSDPNNYVLFNDELWRIIGVMNNVKDSSGTSASRIKLIRAESIGNYSWDNKPKGTGSSIDAYGSNDWTDARLMSTLNSGPYWNRTTGTCYNGENNASSSCDFTKVGLTDKSKNMISEIIWNIGGHGTLSENSAKFYLAERGTSVYSNRTTAWKGFVGLMYPSDYGYAVGDGVRSSCLSASLGNYQDNNCQISDWLFINDNQWTLSPHSADSRYVFSVGKTGNVYDARAYYTYSVNPVVYLNNTILITKGEGTESNPYKISFEKEVQINNTSSKVAIPKLDDEGKLIPVTLADDGTVTYIRENNTNWYNYDGQRWANAVILIDSPSKSYKVGDIILESDIESYFVWIPKYKYKLWNVETMSSSSESPKHTIDIVFDTTDTTDIEGVSCKTPMTSGATGNCNNGEYMTHPAFISLGVNGFWVGKFETGYKGATSKSAAHVSSLDPSKIIIKPNVYSWGGNTVYNYFLSAYNYERSLDSHMMKNTEWGAVAYLSHSKYGINEEVNINNNSSYKTGYSALPTTKQSTYPGTYGDGASYNQPYNTEVGYLASTTGNITGVYDMAGCGIEYMSSYVSGKLSESGFSTATLSKYDTKYFDVYNASSTQTTYQYRILGDATGEMSPFTNYKDADKEYRYHNSWYADMSYFVDSTWPWFRRGGDYTYGVLAGVFEFSRYTGGPEEFSRLVLTG